MEMMHFLKLVVWVDPHEDEDHDPALPTRLIRRMACIPIESIAYVQEGVNRATTTIVLADGDVFLADEPYETIFEAWQTWYNAAQRTFISYRNN